MSTGHNIAINNGPLIFADLCKSQTSLARPIEGNCRAHWTCLQGQSSMMCCPDQMAFHPVRGCIADPTCTTPCHQEQEPAEGNKTFATFRPISSLSELAEVVRFGDKVDPYK